MATRNGMSRRAVLAGVPAVWGLAAPGLSRAFGADGPPGADELPRLEYVYTARVGVSGALEVGEVPDGRRRVIPITGGTFDGPKLRGVVLPGGADWNLSRSDGATVFEASYYMRTDDGVIVRITNTGVGEPPRAGAREPRQPIGFTTPRFDAPKGKYDWLNRSVFVGTVSFDPAAKDPILIRVYRVV